MSRLREGGSHTVTALALWLEDEDDKASESGSLMPTVLELCAGAGGQALGFERAGFEHAALIDFEPHSCATLRMNRPYWNVIEADLTRLDASYWAGVDVVAAGLPCPPFSVAGKQLGSDDERDLFPALLRIVRATEPRIVMVENVRGLMQNRFESYRSNIISLFMDMGYSVEWQLLDAFHYGTPQHRVRSFMVAVPKGEVFGWPQPREDGGTVGETLFAMMAEQGWRQVSKWANAANRPAPTLVGGSCKHGGADLGPTRSRAAWAALGVDGLGMADAPPPLNFRGRPRLTVAMAARLQSFPSDWALAGRKTQQYRQVGNALPVNLGAAMALAVGRHISS